MVHMKKCVVEFFGTSSLIFVGTGAIILKDHGSFSISNIEVAFLFGVLVSVTIYFLGDISGAPINPAVTLGFWAARRFPASQVLPYLVSQWLGALLASFSPRLLFPHHLMLGAIEPATSIINPFVSESFMTFLLRFVILCISRGSKIKGFMAGIAVGGFVALEMLLADPISNVSLNPARSLALAVVVPRWENLWIYLVAPLLGAFLAAPVCRCTQLEDCCSAASEKPSL